MPSFNNGREVRIQAGLENVSPMVTVFSDQSKSRILTDKIAKTHRIEKWNGSSWELVQEVTVT